MEKKLYLRIDELLKSATMQTHLGHVKIMSKEEQEQLKTKYYNEAIRYMNNAKDVLQKAGKENGRYKDPKYVKMACGTAYNAVLLALNGWMLLKGVKRKKGRKSIEYYCSEIAKIDKKLLATLDDVYHTLHLDGYYDGVTNVKVIQIGFEEAYVIINKLKPA